jgi:transcription elongation factor GreB
MRLMKSAAGDSVVLAIAGQYRRRDRAESGRYERIAVEPFREPPGSEPTAKGLTRRR